MAASDILVLEATDHIGGRVAQTDDLVPGHKVIHKYQEPFDNDDSVVVAVVVVVVVVVVWWL